mmetsp:Transcript_80765/g.261862  ORF Transcript_80765/g.261862 Transcript_80765/m.261862 type:complete len:305 (-) Transcript_80765:394-1308(-)
MLRTAPCTLRRRVAPPGKPSAQPRRSRCRSGAARARSAAPPRRRASRSLRLPSRGLRMHSRALRRRQSRPQKPSPTNELRLFHDPQRWACHRPQRQLKRVGGARKERRASPGPPPRPRVPAPSQPLRLYATPTARWLWGSWASPRPAGLRRRPRVRALALPQQAQPPKQQLQPQQRAGPRPQQLPPPHLPRVPPQPPPPSHGTKARGISRKAAARPHPTPRRSPLLAPRPAPRSKREPRARASRRGHRPASGARSDQKPMPRAPMAKHTSRSASWWARTSALRGRAARRVARCVVEIWPRGAVR